MMKNMLIYRDISAVLRRIYMLKLLQQRGAGIPLFVNNLLDVGHFGLMTRR